VIEQLRPELHLLSAITNAVTDLDVFNSFATCAVEYDWCCPELVTEPGLHISDGRHPVIESLSAEPFVANPLLLTDQRRMLMITGPNMGGKSTFMRQNALIALLSYTGSYVPAAQAIVGPIDRIFTRIGASDDLASGQSTFMVEMTEAANILHNATPRSLVLMDEIGRGTSTFDGLALAFACAEHLATTNRALCLFATHYFELTDMAQTHSTIENVHLDAVEHNGKIIFMHQIKTGAANKSYGLQVAELAGVPKAALSYAKARLAELESSALPSAVLVELSNTPDGGTQSEQLANSGRQLYSVPEPGEPTLVSQKTLLSTVPQLDLFSADSPVLDYVKCLVPDETTPKDALEHLYAIKELLKS
jgi:DNA mismatch repair protein MutS